MGAVRSRLRNGLCGMTCQTDGLINPIVATPAAASHVPRNGLPSVTSRRM